MPFYQYTCPTCGKEKEVFKNVSKCYETELCEECKSILERSKDDFCKAYLNTEGFYGKVSN